MDSVPSIPGSATVRRVRVRPGVTALAVAGLLAVAGAQAQTQAASPPSASESPNAANFAAYVHLSPRVVKIHAREPGGRIALGSGVPIARDLVVTNCHVTRRAESIQVAIGATFGVTGYEVVAQASDPEHDLCVLRTEVGMPIEPIPMGAAPRVGDPVWGLGFSGGFGVRMHPGEVTALYPHDGGKVLQTSTSFNLGASGGGLFNAAHELVGILTFRDRAGAAQFYSMPVAWVAQVLSYRPFVPVAPLGPAPVTAFWERAVDDQPPFLRANALEATRRWSDLETMALNWVDREPDNATAWLVLGRTFLQTGKLVEAIQAFNACLAADNEFAAAWYQLGVAHLLSNQAERADEVADSLAMIDAPLARALKQRTIEFRAPAR